MQTHARPTIRRALVLVALAIVMSLTTMSSRADAWTTYWLWLYQRNGSNHTDGRLHLERYDYLYAAAVWRAGSGSAPYATDECYRNYGWLPGGQYDVIQYSYNWPGTTVKGPVLRLSDHQCWNGTWRTQLFVHSSYPWSGSRYSSYGCVKASSTGTASTAGGDVRAIVDHHVGYGVPAHLVVW